MTARSDKPARQALVTAVLDHLLGDGQTDASLRALATAAGVSHSLLLYHFGSRDGLMSAVLTECDRRQLGHLADLHYASPDSVELLEAAWKHVADERMWPLYRLAFALRSLNPASVAAVDADDRERWIRALTPLVASAGVAEDNAPDEALLWLCACRGLLWELVSGADPEAVDRAATRLIGRYDARREAVGGRP